MSEEQIKQMRDILSKFGEAHTMLARTKLPAEIYNPISHLLIEAKVDLYKLYIELKTKP